MSRFEGMMSVTTVVDDDASSQNDIATLLAMRAGRPAGRPEDIARWRQLHRIEASVAPALLVIGPAGYGKSTLVGQWAQAQQRPVIWLTVTRRCRSLERFAQLLCGAFQAAGVRADALAAVVAGPDAVDVDTALHALHTDLAASGQRATIVLDDIHLASDPAIFELVSEFIDTNLPGLRAIIISRAPPPLPVARFRVRGLLDVLNASDLRFSVDEAQELLSERLTYNVCDDVTRQIVQRMEGWPAGLEMVALAVNRRPPDDMFGILESFSSDDLLLREFLLEEVLNSQPAEVREFLLQTSICEHYCHDLCAAVTGRDDAAELLDRIQRAGLFVVSLDARGEWHRYHQLFAEFLRTQLLRERGSEQVAALHRSACEWLAANGLTEDALDHAVAAQDWELASLLIRPEVVRWFEQDRSAEIAEWLQEFPSELLEHDALLAFLLAFSLARLGHGREALEWGAVAERIWDAEGSLDERSIATFVRGCVARFRLDGAEAVRQAERALELLDEARAGDTSRPVTPNGICFYDIPGLPGVSNTASLVQRGTGLRMLGRSQEAERELQQLFDYAQRHGPTLIASAALTDLGIVWSQQGRLHQAHDAWLRVIEHLSLPSPPVRRMALIQLAGLYCEWNRLDDALPLLVEAEQMSDEIQYLTLRTELYLTWAQLEWARGHSQLAYQRVTQAIKAGETLDSEVYARAARALRARFWLRDGELDAARAWAREAGLAPDTDLDYGSFEEHLSYVRVLMASDDSPTAVCFLERLLIQTESDGRYGDALRIRVALALAYQDLFDLDAAINTLEPALELVRQAGYIRTFLEEGTSMVRLLRVALRRNVSTIPIATLLNLAGEEVTIRRVTHRELVEPISPREIEVLRLIAVGLSNKEIAEELCISVSTVKRHITNAYGKLGVSNRAEAIERSQALEILQ